MTIYFDHPLLLLIAIIAIPLTIAGWRASKSMGWTRRFAAIGLRAILLAVLAVMLASPHTAREHNHLTVIGLLDVSTSVQRFANLPVTNDLSNQDYLEYLRQWFRQAADIKQPDDRFALIVFDGRAAAITTPNVDPALNDSLAVTMVEGTNISEAIRLGLALFPGDTARRLVLVSDGNETAGNALEAARQAAAALDLELHLAEATAARATIPIDVVPIAYNVPSDVQIVQVEAPPQAQTSQTVTVRVVLESAVPTSGRLSLRHEGRFIDLNGSEPGTATPLDLPSGQSVQRISVELLDTRVNRFQAIFEPDDPAADALVENNSAEAFTATPAEGKVLIVDDAVDRRANVLAQILTDGEFDVETKAPIEFPSDLLSLQRYDLVVLDNIPSYALTVAQHELLARYVNDLGGGLIMLGGQQSFGAGGWNNSAIEDILPLELDPPRELRLATAALVLVLDRSGSMNAPVAGARASQQAVANEGAALAVESLRESSYVGVVTFDATAHEHVPLQRNDDPETIANRIREIRADGSTNLLPALVLAHEMLRTVDVEKKRVVCLSDGQSPTQGLAERVTSMVGDGIQITTIAVGDGADYETLSKLADMGGGAFYEVRNPRVLPSVLIDSVQILNKPLIKEGAFVPQVRPGATALSAGMQEAPPLNGLVITAPKDAPVVSIDLTHPDGEPLLAQWQAGLGRVAAFTSSVHPPWGDAWQSWPTAATFFSQLARRTGRPGMTQDTELVARIQDNRLVVQLKVRPVADENHNALPSGAAPSLSLLQVHGVVYRPDGASQEIRLRQTGPDVYSTTIPADAAGNYIVALTPKRDGQPLAPVIGGASRTGSAELRRYQSNIELLREIATLTNGRILEISDPTAVNMFDRQDLPATRSILPIWRSVLLATLALLLVDIANRRVAWSTTGLVAASRRAVERAKAQRARAKQIAVSVGTLRETSPVIRPARSAKSDPTSSAETSTERRPAEVSFRTDRTTSPTDDQSKPTGTPAKQKRKPPDRKAVDAALDQLLGHPGGAAQEPDKPDELPQTQQPDEQDTPSRTSSLLEAKRRTQQRLRESDD